MDFKDYYAILGVAKAASEKEIKQAYRKLARKHHPDVNPGDKAAEGRFKEINEAYEVLGDPEKRRRYDELGANWRMYEQAQPGGPNGSAGGPFPGGGGGWSFHFGGGEGSGHQGGFRTISEEEMHRIFGDQDPFSDFFHTFFGGADAGRRTRGARGSAKPRRGHDVEEEIELSLDEAYQGSMRRLSIKHDGHTRTVDVRIPSGVVNGSRVRIAGEGESGQSGAGDLYLRIRIAPHDRYELKGRDLHARVPVPVTTAVLGGEASVATPGGKTLKLKVPQGTQNGQVFRLKGHGMPVLGKSGEAGDLYAVVDIQVPRQLTPEQQSHYEALARIEGRS